MPKLNQIIAVEAGEKGRAHSRLTELHQATQKGPLFVGREYTYRPRDEEGETLPPDSQRIQLYAVDILNDVADTLTTLFDVVATKDWANTEARADVVVDGETLLENVPVTYLLFLEKQLVDILTFVRNLPTLDPSRSWHYDQNAGAYATESFQTTRTKKVLRNHVKAEATKEHPAQVEVYTEDVIVGDWTKIDYSGALPADRVRELEGRVETLQNAVKFARESANNSEADPIKVGEAVFAYLFE